MLKKKICMIGAFAVGKTSLVQRYAKSIFSEKYHTTIGVKIDQKTVFINEEEINLLLWDIHGEDEYQKIKSGYLMGSSGFLIVLDGTRKNTIEVGKNLLELVKNTIGDKPFLALINKSDLKDQWEINKEDIDKLKEVGWNVHLTSAKEDVGVNEAFIELTNKMILK